MSEGTQLSRLPRLIEPGKLAQQHLSLRGFVPSDQLERMLNSVLSLSDISCDLHFSVDEQYRRIIKGELAAKAELTCQRCLEAVPAELTAEVHIAVVKDEDRAKSLPSWLDPWIIEDSEADLYELIEEELLLALPQIALHDKDCLDPALYSSGEDLAQEEDEGENPFKVLEKLKQKD